MQTLTNATMATTNSTIELILRHFRAGPIASTSFRRIGFMLRKQALQHKKRSSGWWNQDAANALLAHLAEGDLRPATRCRFSGGPSAPCASQSRRTSVDLCPLLFPAPFQQRSAILAFVFRSRQCLDVIARIAQGAEHTAIRQRDRNMEGARQDISDGP